MRKREAIILAGGFGTRLAHIVPDVPKPMAPVAGRPFLRFILDFLDDNNFAKVVIADGYKKECIENYFGDSYRGLKIKYSSETSPLLTGGAVKQALKHCSEEWVCVFNGDTFFDAPISMVYPFADTAPDDVSAIICSKEMRDFSRYGTLEVNPEEKTITGFNEKKACKKGLINAGVYCLRSNCLDSMPNVFSLETDFFEKQASLGNLRYIDSSGYFIDIGVPEDYRIAQTSLKKYIRHWRLALFDRDGTINVDTGHLFEKEKLELIDKTVRLLKKYNENGSYRVVVVTNQAGIAKGLYDVGQMDELHGYLNEQLSNYGAKIDAFYYCPHHPQYTGPCTCRKPQPGMILRALSDYDASAEESIMYGDKETDRMAAQAAGVEYTDIQSVH